MAMRPFAKLLYNWNKTMQSKSKSNPKQTQNRTKLFCFGFVSALHACETKRWNQTKVAYLSIIVLTSPSNTAVSSTLCHLWQDDYEDVLCKIAMATAFVAVTASCEFINTKMWKRRTMWVRPVFQKRSELARTLCWWPNFAKSILANIMAFLASALLYNNKLLFQSAGSFPYRLIKSSIWSFVNLLCAILHKHSGMNWHSFITDVIVVCVCGCRWLAETSETVLGFAYFSTCE